jgi:hypothetical protein
MISKNLLFFLAFLNPIFAVAATPGSISTALAGGGRSAIAGTESYLVNPASLAHFDGASLTLSTYFHQIPSQDYDSKSWRVSIAENSPLNDVPLALSYAKNTDLYSQQNDFWFTAGNFVSPYVAVGIAYHYSEWRLQNNSQTLMAVRPNLPNSAQMGLLLENNASLGVLVTPNPELGFSFVAQDFIKQTEKKINDYSGNSNGSNIKTPINAPQIGLGVIYLHSSFMRLHADLMTDQSPIYKHHTQVSLGLENMVNEWVLTRWGVSRSNFAISDNSENKDFSQNAIAFGIGFIGPRFEVYLATKQNTGFQKSQEHSVDFHIPF